MEAREKAYIRNWEQKHGKGKWTFLVLSPVIWAGLLILAYAAFRLAWNGVLSFSSLYEAFLRYGLWKWWLVLSLLLFCLEALLWQMAYRKYLRIKKKRTLS